MQISTFKALDPMGIMYCDRDKDITFLSFDSRTCSKGCAFFCFPGFQTNGEQFISEAIKKGAILIITNSEVEHIKGVSYFVSTIKTRTLYAKASALFFNYPAKKLKLIGITGTDGKTSTSYFTYQLFSLFNKKVGLLNTVNYSTGEKLQINNFHQSTPESFYVNSIINESVNNGCEFFILEATSHALSSEFDRLSDIDFDISAYTNISSEHLEFHKTYSRYIESKCNLALKTKSKIFVYDDNKERDAIINSNPSKIELLSLPNIVNREFNKLSFEYGSKLYHLPFGQTYNLENAFEAANIVSNALALPLSTVLEKLQHLIPVSGRFQIVDNTFDRNIIIDFAHTPKAYQAIMENMIFYKGDNSFIAVFGSSGKRDSSKRPDMGKVLSNFCDILIVTEDDNRGEDLSQIYKELTSQISNSTKIIRLDDRMDAIKKALTLSKPGDFIFLLGIGPQNGIDKGSYIKKWNEYDIVQKLLKQLF